MSQPSPGKGESVLSLQNISRTFFTALQRQHDMLAFSIAGLHTADPKAYEHFSTMSRVMPVPQAHLPPEQMLAYARGLMMRTTINDLLTLSAECMSQCFLLCLFIREQGKNPRRDPLVEKIIGEKHQAFLKMSLQDRFTALEQEFGIVCELEDGIFSLAAALRVLARGGLVTNDDITPDGDLTLEFKSMKDVEVAAEQAGEEDPAAAPPPGLTRTVKPGEMLGLTDAELLGLNITVSKFVDGLLRSVDHFGRAQLGEGA
ncbi:MAG: hypothetical protein ACKOBS_07410 [Verrucomicrobiota bacterium]